MDARLEKTIEKEGGYSTGKDGKDGTPTGEAKIVDTSYLKEVLLDCHRFCCNPILLRFRTMIIREPISGIAPVQE